MNPQNSTTISFLLIVFCFFLPMGEQKCANIDYKKDSTQIKNLLSKAQDNATLDFSESLVQAHKALNLAQTLLDNELLSKSYRAMGFIYENNNHLAEAYSWYEKALALKDYLPNSSKLDIYLDWAIINKKLANYEITRDYYQRTLDLAHETNDSEMVQYVYTGLGSLNGSIGEFDKAIEFHFRSKELAEKRSHTEGVIFAHVNIANTYLQAKNYKVAYSHLQKGYDLVVNVKDSTNLDLVLNTYGQVLNAEKKYAEAITYHQKALVFCEKTKDKWMIARTLGFIADAYTKQGQYKDAEIIFNRCFQYQDYFDFYEQPNLYLTLGNLYLKTNRLSQATEALNKSLAISLKRDFKDIVQKSNLGLADVFEKKGDNNAALKHTLIAELYRDSIFNEDKSKKLSQVQYKYHTEKSEIDYKINLEKSEKEIQALQLSQKRTVLYLISIALFALFSSIFTFFYIKQKNKTNDLLYQKNKEIEFQNERLEKSNEILKQFAYASAHDLKEPLRSISNFISIINRRYAKLLPPEASEYMNFVVMGVQRMEKLISALLMSSTNAAEVEETQESLALSQALNDI